MYQPPNEGEATRASTFADLQRSMHDPGFWVVDDADAQAMFAPYAQLSPDDLRLEDAFGLAMVVAQELSRVRMVAKALALDQAAAAHRSGESGTGGGRGPRRAAGAGRRRA